MGLVTVALVSWLSVANLQTLQFWSLVVIASWLALLTGQMLWGRLDLTEPIHWLNGTMALLFGLHPLAVVLGGGSLFAYHDTFDISRTYGVAIRLGLAAFFVMNLAYYAGRGRAPSGPFAKARARVADPDLRFLVYVGVASAAAGVIGVLLRLTYGVQAGNASGNFGAGKTAYLYLLPLCLIPSSLVFLHLYQVSARRVYVWLAVLCSLAGAAFYASTGERSYLLFAAGAPIAYLLIARMRTVRRGLVVAIILLATFGLGALRDVNAPGGSLSSSVASAASSPTEVVSRSITGADTEMVDALALELTVVPSEIPLMHGIVITSTLGAPVPRLIWPSKPVTADVVLNGYLFHRGANEAGVAYSLLGEGYLDSGAVGLLAVAALLGWIYGRLRRWHTASRAPLSTAVYAVMLVVSPLVLRGIIAYSLAVLLFCLGPLFLAMYVERSRGTKRLERLRSR